MKTNRNSSELKSRSEQLSTWKTGLQKIDFARRRVNRHLDTATLLTVLRATPRFFELAEVVGKWVWIRFSQKQPNSVTSRLAELGFHWNNTRQTWQHPCGVFRRERATFDPRRVYRSYFATDLKPI